MNDFRKEHQQILKRAMEQPEIKDAMEAYEKVKDICEYNLLLKQLLEPKPITSISDNTNEY